MRPWGAIRLTLARLAEKERLPGGTGWFAGGDAKTGPVNEAIARKNLAEKPVRMVIDENGYHCLD